MLTGVAQTTGLEYMLVHDVTSPCDDVISPCDDVISPCDDVISPCDDVISPCDDATIVLLVDILPPVRDDINIGLEVDVLMTGEMMRGDE